MKENMKKITIIMIVVAVMCIVSVNTVQAGSCCTPDGRHFTKEIGRKNPTCTEAGWEKYWFCMMCGKYFFDKDGNMDCPGVPIISKIEHSYGKPTFTWANNFSNVTAKFICGNDSSHVKTEECIVSSYIMPASCLGDGKITYTATCTLDGEI